MRIDPDKAASGSIVLLCLITLLLLDIYPNLATGCMLGVVFIAVARLATTFEE